MKFDPEILQIVEALMTASPEPLNQAGMNQSLQQEDVQLAEVVEALQERFARQGRPVVIEQVAGGYHLVTKAEYAPYLQRLLRRSGRLQLTKAALEALAIIVYKQPITKTGVDQIRGVNSESVLRSLLEKELVTIKGREESQGRPLLYGTTQEFLQAFGLNRLGDLPKLKELEEILGTGQEPVSLPDAIK